MAVWGSGAEEPLEPHGLVWDLDEGGEREEEEGKVELPAATSVDGPSSFTPFDLADVVVG